MFDQNAILEGASLAPAAGQPATMGERFGIDLRVTQDQMQFASDRAAIDRAYDAYAEELSSITGKRVKTPVERMVSMGGNPGFVKRSRADARLQALAEQEFDKEIRRLAEQHEGVKVKTREDILGEIGVARADQRRQQADVTARTIDFPVTLAGFGAQTLGIVSDPIVAGSMLIGAPWSAGILRTALIEARIGIGVESLVQTQVQLGRRKFGEDPSASDALQAIAAAGAGGFLLGGLVKGVARGVGGVRELLAKSRELPESARTSEVRSAEAYLERVLEAEDASPYPDTPQGRAVHAERLAAAELALREGRVADLPPAGQRTVRQTTGEALLDDALPQETIRAAKQAARDRIRIDEQQRAVGEALAPLLDDDEALAALYRDLRAKPERVESLLSFLRRSGGVRDEGGELGSLGVTARTLPGLLRREGRSLDDAALAAQEAGFFSGRNLEAGDRITPRDLLEAVAEEVNGRPVFRAEDQAQQMDEAALREIREALLSADLDVARVGEGAFRERLQQIVRAIVERDRGAQAASLGRAGADAADVEERLALMSEEDALDEADVLLRYEGREGETIAVETEDGIKRMTVRQMLDELSRDEEDLAALKLCTIGGGRG